MTPNVISYWNRKKGALEIEQVYGDVWLQRVYGTRLGRVLADGILSQAWLSKLYGMFQASKLSKRKVLPFIQDYKIPMDEYEGTSFETFNDFFIRKFKPTSRVFTDQPNEMPAFAEARYYAYDRVRPEQTMPIKGKALSAIDLMGGEEDAAPFMNGPLLLARLCPTDYHRYHYPDSGKTLKTYRLHGKYHSVNPMALRYKSEILSTNERHVSILETQNFGKLAYIEVGAMCVGKIVQTHPDALPFTRGDEKGYFLFGGSTVVVLGEPGRWKPDRDLVEKTASGVETLVQLGDRIATS